MSDIGAKKNTSDHHNNQPAFSKEIECIYNTLVEDVGIENRRDIILERGMMEWLVIFSIKPVGSVVSRRVFRIEPAADTLADELIILFANIIGGVNHGIL